MRFYIHEVPGRLRVKIPGLKRNFDLADELRLLLREKQGINSLEVNALTGSIKINFDESKVTSAALLNLLSMEGHVDLTKLLSSGKYIDKMFSQFGRVASKAILGIAIDKIFEGSSFSILSVII